MADHRQQTFLWSPAMDVAVPGPHGTKRRAQIVTDAIQNWFSKCKAATKVTDEGRKDIALALVLANRDAERFLPPADKNSAMNLPGTIQTCELFIQGAS